MFTQYKLGLLFYGYNTVLKWGPRIQMCFRFDDFYFSILVIYEVSLICCCPLCCYFLSYCWHDQKQQSSEQSFIWISSTKIYSKITRQATGFFWSPRRSPTKHGENIFSKCCSLVTAVTTTMMPFDAYQNDNKKSIHKIFIQRKSDSLILSSLHSIIFFFYFN